MPYEDSVNSGSDAFALTNQGDGVAIFGTAKGTGPAIFGKAEGSGPAIVAEAIDQSGLLAVTSGSGTAVDGFADGDGVAVFGTARGTGPAVFAKAEGGGPAIVAEAIDNSALRSLTFGSGTAVEAIAEGSGRGLLAEARGGGSAAEFIGDVGINGSLVKSAGSFKIDHPLDPATRYLYHSFVESPDMMNVYNGNVTLDSTGEAWVELPEWFEALNRDFRYQLTPIGAPAPYLYIAEKIAGNRFKIAGGQSGSEVSWQVTGIRQDPYANAHRVPIERDKPEAEQGFYLHPELYREPETRSLEWGRDPERMRRLKRLGSARRAETQ